jgi:hypothetical protein
MKLVILLFLVGCSSFHKETLKDQNDKAVEYNCPCDRVNRMGPNKR